MKKFNRVLIFLILTGCLSVPVVHPAAAATCSGPTQTSLVDGGTTYTVQTFTTVETNCTWTVPAAVTSIGVLVVGGGGGAAFGSCGGGGGGGRVIVSDSTFSVWPGTNISLTVGAGGSGGWYTSSDWRMGSSGNPSSVVIGGNTYTASGGGGGGGGTGTNVGLAGGSGGGGSGCSTASGGAADSSAISGFTTYATAGGTGNSTGGGGGGAGGAGSLGSGGAGRTIWGVTLAGGGGGWSSGSGGSGGGGSALSGTSTKALSGNAGTAGTGGGGGGGNNGGSGRVMIRYVVDTLGPTFTNSNAFSIAENTSTATNAATITVSESATIIISSGVDSATFTIISSDSTTARIRFLNSPDYEDPRDVGLNNIYDIAVRATDSFGNASTMTLTITVTNVNESSTLNAPSIAATVYKGITTTITITSNVAGTVRFFVGGKRISNCLGRIASGTYPNNSATCNWKPPVAGRHSLTASLTPTDNTFSAATSGPTLVWVIKRTTIR